MNKEEKVYFANLDGLRFFAFALVFLHHGFGNIFTETTPNFFLSKLIRFLFFNGGTGVSIFFVLSGFLITYLIITEINLTGKLDVKAFYIRRTLRIWPLYFCVVFFAFEIYPFLKSLIGMHSYLCSRPIFYYLFLSNFDIIHLRNSCVSRGSMMESITWSVAIEEQFYLVWPLFFLLISKRKLVYFFYCVIILSIVFRALNVNDNDILYFHTLSVCGDLAIGGLGAYYSINSNKFRNILKNIRPNLILFIYILGLTYCIFGSELNLRFFAVYDRLISNLFFLFIILEQNFNNLSIYKFNKLKLISTAGKYTYGYYLLHPIAIMVVYNTYKLLGVELDNWGNILISGIIALLLTFFISFISYKYFESYFIKLKHKFSYLSST